MNATLSLIIGGAESASVSVPDGWHLIGASLDTSAESLKAWLDGVEEVSAAATGASLPASSLYPLQIGGQTVSDGIIGVSVPQDLAELIVVPAALSTADSLILTRSDLSEGSMNVLPIYLFFINPIS